MAEVHKGPVEECLECQIWKESPTFSYKHYLFNPMDDTQKFRFDFNTAVRDKSEEAIQILLRKHADYGSKNISQSPGGAMNGLRVRLWDKIARLNNLVDSGVEPENESLYDTFLDICNYGLIGMLIIDDMWDKED